MFKQKLPIVFIFLFATVSAYAQSTEELRQRIEGILAGKKAKVGVAIMGDDGKDTLSVNGKHHFPMQSVFKFHIALTLLAQKDQEKFALDKVIIVRQNQLLPGLYSPLREKYPQGFSLPISEIMKYTVSQSDNVGCDALLRWLGGPGVVEDYILSKGFKDFSVKINEEVMQNNWDLQFSNWTTPQTSNQILYAFYNKKAGLLPPKYYDFIWKLMRETQTGPGRLRGKLPKKAVVAHKTGWSGTNKEGVTAAVNDVGVVFLPNNHHFFISVFVTDARESAEACEGIIADISKAAWDYFLQKGKK